MKKIGNTTPAPYSSSPTAPEVVRGDDSLHKGLEDGFQVSHKIFTNSMDV